MMQGKTLLLFSIVLFVLIAVASGMGLFTPGFYAAENANWQAQSLGQDLVDGLLVAPCLLISGFAVYKKNRAAASVWAGTVLYCTYTFTIYCFTLHFNQLFLVYCACLGISFYGFVYFLFSQSKANLRYPFSNQLLLRITGIYFLVLAVLFYFLWLSEIVPAILHNSVPKSIQEAGIITNAVHVLDLSVLLPAIFITGVLLLKRRPLGFVLTPILLTFCILMDITIGMLVIVMKKKGVEADLTVTYIMIALALISLNFLVLFFHSPKSLSPEDSSFENQSFPNT